MAGGSLQNPANPILIPQFSLITTTFPSLQHNLLYFVVEQKPSDALESVHEQVTSGPTVKKTFDLTQCPTQGI